MAVDEALLESFLAGRCLTTLRLYAWSPAAVSLGRFQPVRWEESGDAPSPRGAISLSLCDDLGLPVVRRPTGGRAILHDRELTYSIVMAHGGVGITESYKALSEGLRRGLERLGLDCGMGRSSGSEGASFASCFASAARSDLVASPSPVFPFSKPRPSGAKLVGSAQCRRGDALLQQGTLPFSWNRELYGGLFGRDPGVDGAGSLEELLGEAPSWERVADAIAEGYRELWGEVCQWHTGPTEETERGDLTEPEQETARRLYDERYAKREWTCAVSG